ncbi:MAG: Rne/Rng family ribonuclease [Bacteroidetes bacterium]|nr:Rne/Rng family ribonuclease [Bacteroidota bacterium]MBV6460275.1 Ribonuclease G [Flavobacteriales bacterium]OQY74005.1 MAG: ribonuclease E/G [Ignavibacteriales bacterium UTCHB3]WKZ74643.1 MAG: Rne/Rng family ribonuclease [Vicingaceae bacterium]MCL4815859.1 Rne/Rng family ribonuclease [Flavobacteriales bacterium]
MSVDLIIDSSASEVVIGLLHDKQLVELHRERTNNNYTVGDIYLGKVKKVMPGLNAVFVDVGYEKDAFLHYLDLGPQYNSLAKFLKNTISSQTPTSNLTNFQLEADIEKNGKINQIVSSGQQILVQIAKEPISSKGPRLTSEISIPGRYIVLVPFASRVSVSQKIKSGEERDRLIKLLQGIKPKGFGVIIRTVAENKSLAELESDLSDILSKWKEMVKNIPGNKPPFKVLGELNRASAILRDLLSPKFNSIVVNDEAIYNEVKKYLKNIAPDKENIAKIYKGKTPVFDQYGVEKQIKALFGKTVTLKTGAYLIIEHTEALHVIDVNSGYRSKSGAGQEQNAFEVNMEAAEEIARQLRLRDMGGIIVVDFIDMKEEAHREQLFQRMKEVMKSDRAKHSILPPSKFGLIQITRQRVRPEMEVNTTEKCPSCDGTGQSQASILLENEIENHLRYITSQLNLKKVALHVHPFIEAYLRKGIFSIRWKWQKKYKCKINIVSSASYGMLKYSFFDANEEEIKF